MTAPTYQPFPLPSLLRVTAAKGSEVPLTGVVSQHGSSLGNYPVGVLDRGVRPGETVAALTW